MNLNMAAPIVVKAMEFTVVHYKQALRNDTKTPYLVHLFNVVASLAKAEADDEVIAAGFLHDIVNDTPVTIRKIRRKFGGRISSIVEASTKKHKLEKSNYTISNTWRERKEHIVYDIMPNASNDQLLVILADKLDILIHIQTEYKKLGDKIWQRFNAGKKEQKWYYDSMVEAIRKNNNRDEKSRVLFYDFKDVYDNIFGELDPDEIIRIAIANDHQIFRTGIRNSIERIYNYKIVLEADSFADILEKIRNSDAEVLLLDDQMPAGDFIESIKELRRLKPELKIIQTTFFCADAKHVIEAKGLLDGAVSAINGGEAFQVAVKTVYLGGTYFNIPGSPKKR